MGIIVRNKSGTVIQTSDNRNRKKFFNPKTGVRQINIVIGRSSSGRTIIQSKDLSTSQARGLRRLNVIKSQVAAKQATKQQVAAAIIKSLEDSARRTQTVKNRERAIQQAVASRTPFGQQLKSIGLRANLKRQTTRDRPFSLSYKEELRRAILASKPLPKFKGKYQPVKIQGVVYIPSTQREANYLANLKQTIARDQKLKTDFNNAISRTKVQSGDRWFVKAGKGAIIAGVGVLFSGQFLGNAGEKLVAGLAGVGASKDIRTSVLQESKRAAKATPHAVAESLDPRKPENWANIILVAFSVASVARGLRVSGKGASRAVKIKSTLSRINKSLQRLKIVKRLARRAPRKHARIIKRITIQEKALRKQKTRVTALEKERIKLRREAGLARKGRTGKTVKGRAVLRGGKKVYPFEDAFTGKIRYFKSFKSWKKAVVASERLKAQGVKTIKQRAAKTSSRRRAALLEKERRVLRKEAALQRKGRPAQTKKILSKKQRQTLSLKVRRGLINNKKDFKNFRILFKSKSRVKITPSLKKKVFDVTLNRKGEIVVSHKGKVLIVEKQANTARVIKIDPPKKVSGGVEVSAGNGQVVILKPLKTTRVIKLNQVIKTISKTKKVVIVKPATIKEINAYYLSLLSLSRQGISLRSGKTKNKAFAALSLLYEPLFKTGSVRKSIVAPVSARPKVAVFSRSKSKTKPKSVTKAAVKPVSRVAIAAAVAIKPRVFYERLLKTILKRLTKPLKRTTRRRLPKIPSIKKLTQKQKDELIRFIKKAPRKYRPSLAAVILRITAYKIPKSVTGLEIRPVIIKRKTIKRKKK